MFGWFGFGDLQDKPESGPSWKTVVIAASITVSLFGIAQIIKHIGNTVEKIDDAFSSDEE